MSLRAAAAAGRRSCRLRPITMGAPIRLESRGSHRLKGVPGSWEVFAVVS